MVAKTETGIDGDASALFNEIAALLKAGGKLGEACAAMNPADCEALYAVGYGLYEQGRYLDSFKVFSLLVIHDHTDPRYLFGLGGACQMTGRYADALQHYMAVAVARVDDPLPVFHAAECLIAMCRINEARDSLRLVLDMCSDECVSLQSRAQALLQGLHERSLRKGNNDEHL